MIGRIWLASLGLTLACKPAPVRVPAPRAVPAPAVVAAPPPTTVELAARLCEGLPDCRIRKQRPAGADRQGRALTVVSVDRGWLARDPDAAGPTGDGLAEIVEEEHGDSFSPGPGGCRQFAYWLVVGDPAAPISVQPILELCNDGNGAAGLGEDSVTISDNTLEHSSLGGSNWRWNFKKVVELAPLRLRSVEHDGYFAAGDNTEARRWSFDAFAGEVRWYSPPCNAQGSPQDDAGATRREYAYAAIPTLALAPAFVDGGWKHSGPGRCALAIDAAGQQGHIIHGQPGAPEDASLRVVAAPIGEAAGEGVVLFVELTDDRWVGPGARWLTDDHLELWVGETRPSYMDHCIDADRPQQWAIRIADGRVFAGHGKPDPAAITVERHTVGERVRLRVQLRRSPAALTVVYSDSDDGKAQERLISSSALTFGRLETLGALLPIDPGAATCRVEGGELVPVLLPHTGSTPLL